MRLPFLREKSEAIALAIPGLTAGSQAVRLNSTKFKDFLYTERNIRVFSMLNKGTVLL